jgi:hypothetical protein
LRATPNDFRENDRRGCYRKLTLSHLGNERTNAVAAARRTVSHG